MQSNLMKTARTLLTLGMWFFVSVNAKADILAGWSLQGRDLSGNITANDVAPHILGGIIRRGPGLVSDTSIINGYGATSWATTATFPGTNASGYYSFSFTVEPGWAVRLASMDISYSSAGGTNRVHAVEIRSAKEGYASTLHLDPSVGFSGDRNTILLPGFTNLTGTVEFRLWGFQADSSTALFLLDNDNAFPIAGSTHSAVRFNGTVSPQEPHLSIRCSAVELCWQSASNKTYQVQYRSSLTTNQWTDLDAPVQGNGTTTCIVDTVPIGQPQRFYRVFALP